MFCFYVYYDNNRGILSDWRPQSNSTDARQLWDVYGQHPRVRSAVERQGCHCSVRCVTSALPLYDVAFSNNVTTDIVVCPHRIQRRSIMGERGGPISPKIFKCLEKIELKENLSDRNSIQFFF